MKKEEIQALIEKQRLYYLSGETLDVQYRINALKTLKTAILKYEQEIEEALKKDLGKSYFESYMCEVGLSLSEISYMIKHTRSFSKEKRVRTPLAQYVSRSYTKPSPYGVTLIMSPWNYPFMLTIEPLADALAAGNTVILKPSAYSPNTTQIIKKIIDECFDEKYVALVSGGRAENTSLLEGKFDKIFFTGSVSVGKEVMRKASEHLTPVTLELGGKSPCIIDSSANIKLAAKRIVFGKFLNCGQTCVAPDYIYCEESIKDEFLKEVKQQIKKQYGEDPLKNSDYGKIINEKHFLRIVQLINSDKVVYGGNTNTLQIEPTVMDHVTWGDAVMQEEIFGPILPVLTYRNLDELIMLLQSKEHPLAFYVFSSKKETIKKLTTTCQFGGGCINDTIIHLANSQMGFGGVGASGMGSYHGKKSFDTFSHTKSIVKKYQGVDLPIRYQPYTNGKKKLLRLFLK